MRYNNGVEKMVKAMNLHLSETIFAKMKKMQFKLSDYYNNF